MLASEHNAQMWQVFHKLVCTVDLTVYGVTVESPSSEVKKAIFNYRRSTIGLLQAKFLAEGFVHLEHCFLSCPPFDRPRFNVAFESWGGGDSKVAFLLLIIFQLFWLCLLYTERVMDAMNWQANDLAEDVFSDSFISFQQTKAGNSDYRNAV